MPLLLETDILTVAATRKYIIEITLILDLAGVYILLQAQSLVFRICYMYVMSPYHHHHLTSCFFRYVSRTLPFKGVSIEDVSRFWPAVSFCHLL